MKLKIILSIICCLSSFAFSYNEIHNARYQLYPETFKPNRAKAFTALSTHFDGDMLMPLGVKMGLNEALELGGSLNYKAQKDYFSTIRLQLDLGVSVRVRKNDKVQMDVLIGLGDDKSGGAAFTYLSRSWITQKFSHLYLVKVGFFDGITGGDLCHSELGYYPNIYLNSSVELRAAFTFSSALNEDFGNKIAFDMAPGVRLHLSNNTQLDFDITFGVAGKHQENDALFTLGVTNDF
ncbi:MAG: hypothetical protein OCC49_16445 [Fibrobacterales bacterium]